MQKRYLSSIFVFGVCAGMMGCGAPLGSAAGVREAWNEANNPAHLSSDYVTAFAQLPVAGQLSGSSLPWTDTYWPSYVGGISVRWNSKNPESTAFRYAPLSLQNLKMMTEQQLAALSPAEKFDIVRGLYNYPTVAAERKRNKPTSPTWWGLCHGWAPASIQFPEPRPLVLQNQDGIRVPFGSSDVKALLTYYMGVEKFKSIQSRFIGLTCKTKLTRTVGVIFKRTVTIEGGSDCKDTNAGSFHLALANQIGILNKSFVIDRERGDQIWNQPVIGYRSVIMGRGRPGPNAAPGTMQTVSVRTLVSYVSEIEPQWQPANGTSDYNVGTVQYDYRLELDASGNIIGGEWLSFQRPDFAWMSPEIPLEGDWQILNQFLSP